MVLPDGREINTVLNSTKRTNNLLLKVQYYQ